MDFSLEKELTALFWECISLHCAAVQTTAAAAGHETELRKVAGKAGRSGATGAKKRHSVGSGAGRESSAAGDAFSRQSLVTYHFSRLQVFLKEMEEIAASVPEGIDGVVSRIESVCLALMDQARTVPDLVSLVTESSLHVLGAEGLLLVQPGENAAAWTGGQRAERRREPAEAAARGSEAVQQDTIGLVERIPKGKRKSVNGRMLHAILKNPKAIGWTAVRWAAHLKCARSSVVATRAWKELQLIRKSQRQKATDHRRASQRAEARGKAMPDPVTPRHP